MSNETNSSNFIRNIIINDLESGNTKEIITRFPPEPNGYLVFTNALNKLASLYGIKFNDITNAELNSEEWKSVIPDVNSVNAFVYNGQIYINIDKANLDAPIHEMMHILVGSIRF